MSLISSDAHQAAHQGEWNDDDYDMLAEASWDNRLAHEREESRRRGIVLAKTTAINAVVNHVEHMKIHTETRTHCLKGHLLNESNAYIHKNGKRRCRTCALSLQRKKKANETPEEREARLAKERMWQKKRRANPEYRAKKNKQARDRYALKKQHQLNAVAKEES
jgi:hypothetical protein